MHTMNFLGPKRGHVQGKEDVWMFTLVKTTKSESNMSQITLQETIVNGFNG